MTRGGVILCVVALFVGSVIVTAMPDLLRGEFVGIRFYLGGAVPAFFLSGIAPLIWWHRRSGETGPDIFGFSTQKARGPLLLWLALLVLTALLLNYGT